ncbi:MAG: hypothetical protein KDD82_08330 [Planctomycetes bacterium]|nr:hypothetical protein [Planctomycetota bacterium]
MNLRLLCSALLLALCAGCASDPPPLPPRRQETPDYRLAEKHPTGILVPIDEWKLNLEQELPAPWKLADVRAQIASPKGWTRLGGDRGLELAFLNGEQQQRFWVMPAAFKGQTHGEQVAEQIAINDQFALYALPEAAASWDHTPTVKQALGFE